MRSTTSSLARRMAALALGFAPPCLVAVTAGAADLQPLRAGAWEFSRTIEGPAAGGKPNVVTTKKCTDPAADIKLQRESLAKQGCKFSPGADGAGTVEFEAVCPMGGTTITSKSKMVIENEGAYTVEITSSAPGSAATKEKLVAKRVGNC